jgi:hypothetical protein
MQLAVTTLCLVINTWQHGIFQQYCNYLKKIDIEWTKVIQMKTVNVK